MVKIRKLFGGLGNSMFQYAYLYSQFKKGLIPDIYIQDEKYFEEFKEDIKKMFGEGIGFLPYVSIHVRRGANPANPNEPRYFENPFYVNICDTDYYERAIELFPNEEFIVVSDDIEWCRAKWKDNPRIKVMDMGETDIDDMNLMASCKANIITNSSFSWWAAYLNPNPSKKVVCPKQWFSDGIERCKVPDNWIKI